MAEIGMLSLSLRDPRQSYGDHGLEFVADMVPGIPGLFRSDRSGTISHIA